MKGKKKKYRFAGTDIILTLEKIDGYIYHFECGHTCTDSVFYYHMIDVERNIPNWELNTLFETFKMKRSNNV